MFKYYKFENNVKDNCSLKVGALMYLLVLFSLIIRSEKNSLLLLIYSKN